MLEVSIKPLILITLLLSNLPIILQRSSPGLPRILEAYKLLAVISIPIILLEVSIKPVILISLLLYKNPRILPSLSRWNVSILISALLLFVVLIVLIFKEPKLPSILLSADPVCCPRVIPP